MLPNLLIIGAAKAGTTSLHAYLDLHPEIQMSRNKELRFFTLDDWRDRLDWYSSQFTEAPIRGEASPDYSMYPFRPSTPERIRDLVPDARLIYVLRDPVERAIAHYVEHVHILAEDRPIAEALTDDRPNNAYLCASRYAMQLRRFLDVFPPSQMLLVDHVDLLSRRQEALDQVFRFLNVDPNINAAGFSRVHNTATVKVRYNRLGVWLIQHRLLTQRSGHLQRGPLIAPVRRLLSKPIERELSAPDRTRVTELLRPDFADLRLITGRRWDQWPSFNPPPEEPQGM